MSTPLSAPLLVTYYIYSTLMRLSCSTSTPLLIIAPDDLCRPEDKLLRSSNLVRNSRRLSYPGTVGKPSRSYWRLSLPSYTMAPWSSRPVIYIDFTSETQRKAALNASGLVPAHRDRHVSDVSPFAAPPASKNDKFALGLSGDFDDASLYDGETVYALSRVPSPLSTLPDGISPPPPPARTFPRLRLSSFSSRIKSWVHGASISCCARRTSPASSHPLDTPATSFPVEDVWDDDADTDVSSEDGDSNDAPRVVSIEALESQGRRSLESHPSGFNIYPTMHTLHTIKKEMQFVEDEESRRLCRVAFLS